jgi:hypothetical protein
VLQRDAGVDHVRLAGDRGQHPLGILRVGRFLQQLIAEVHGRVGGDHPAPGMLLRQRAGLVARQPGHVLLRRLPRLMDLGDMTGHDLEVEPDRREQLAPPGGRGGQDEFHGRSLSIASTTTIRSSARIL